MKLWFLSFFLFFFFVVQATPKTEIRAVWLTTIYGLDWPKRAATTAAESERQQQELCEILDRLQQANFNMVFLQVRLRGDVIYRSEIEPVSKVFTGRYGRMPDYDPLAFAIEECRKRGMECHAWIVTFPVGSRRVVAEQDRESIVKRHPEYCLFHNGEWYLNPGEPAVHTYLRSLVKEIVSTYDIDGVQLDYIRYPDNVARFPDGATYRKYGGGKPLNEWRRENITTLVSAIYDDVKLLKPWVQVSSSPLGKYESIPRVPNAVWTANETVLQEAQKWIQQGKQDMIVPMMYYLHDNFFPFVDNWVDNSNGRPFVAGLGAYRLLKEEGDWALNDITNQIDYARHYGASGSAFFRGDQIVSNTKGLYDELQNNYYKYPALLPPLDWLDERIPSTPEEIRVERVGDELKLSWDKPTDEETAYTYTVYYSQSDSLNTDKAQHILTTGLWDTVIHFPVSEENEQEFTFSVSTSSRYRVESLPSKETYYYWSSFLK